MWVERVNGDRSRLKDDADRDRKAVGDIAAGIRDDIKEIREDVKKIFRRLRHPALAEKSPLRLNSLGKTVSKQIDGRAWAGRLATPALKDDTASDPAYQVQEFCLRFVANRKFSPKEVALLQQAAYDNGLDESLVRDVLAIELRDILLQEHGHR